MIIVRKKNSEKLNGKNKTNSPPPLAWLARTTMRMTMGIMTMKKWRNKILMRKRTIEREGGKNIFFGPRKGRPSIIKLDAFLSSSRII